MSLFERLELLCGLNGRSSRRALGRKPSQMVGSRSLTCESLENRVLLSVSSPSVPQGFASSSGIQAEVGPVMSPSSTSSTPSAIVNGKDLYEVVNATTNDMQLWGSDGTPSGTVLLHDFGVEVDLNNTYTTDTHINVNGKAYFPLVAF